MGHEAEVLLISETFSFVEIFYCDDCLKYVRSIDEQTSLCSGSGAVLIDQNSETFGYTYYK